MPLRASILALAVLAVPVTAGAVTVREIIELSKAGLPDEVLTGVIDADRTIFTLDAAQILELKRAGVSRAVILKMLHSREEFEPKTPPASNTSVTVAPAQAAEAMPGVVIIGAQEPARSDSPVLVPYYLPVPIWGSTLAGHRDARNTGPFLGDNYRGFGRFINDGWIEPPFTGPGLPRPHR
jgi:hypothetical protein